MKYFLRKWRKNNLNDAKKYLSYALGEIVLIIMGILIAVNIIDGKKNKKE